MLMNPTTGAALEEAACAHFLPYLTSTEDFDSFETSVAGGMRSFAAKCVARSVEAFDASLREHVPRGWALHEVAERTIVTMVGEVTYRRSVYLDRCGRRRTWADELLGIPKRSRLSACAFLWVVRHAAELSYRKTADEFERETGARISHVTVMNCVREEGRLLKSAPPAGGGISSEAAFVEVDGLWIHLQEHAHRGEALPRQLYEQARRTQSFELKMACCYCGKREVSPGRLERGNLSVTVADEEPDAFWERVAVQLGADYELSDVRELWVGHDGAAWRSADRVAASVPEGVAVAGSLDPFHVLKYVGRAFPEGKSRDWATSLAYRGKGKRLSEMASRIAACMPPGKRRDKVERLASYAAANAADIRFPRTSLGTMEGTNFHVGAVRRKNNATSWSRKGAEAMCLVRAALLTGRPLVAPDKGQLFTEREKGAERAFLGKFGASSIPEACGRGREATVHRLGKMPAISLARRS